MNFLTKIPNKVFIACFGLFLIILLLEEAAILSLPLLSLAGIIFTILVISFLAKNGHFFNSNWFVRCKIAIPFILIGALFKIQHYPFASTLLIAGFAIVLVCYLSYFITKKDKNIIDVLKLLWVITEITGRALKINHFPYGKVMLYYVSPLLLFVLLVAIVMLNMKKNPNWVHE